MEIIQEDSIMSKKNYIYGNQQRETDELVSDSSIDSDATNYDEMDENVQPSNKNMNNVISKTYIINPKSLMVDVELNPGLKKVLFKNHFMEPMSFVLSLHDYAMELKLTSLIEWCGGIVYKHVREMDGFTAVLVKDESIHWGYAGPVFKVSYIAACIEVRKVLDIGLFFKHSLKPMFTKNFNFMDVVYFKKDTWTNYESMAESNNVTKSPNKEANRIIVSSDSEEDLEPFFSNKKVVENKKINKHSRLPYSRTEDENIINFIIKKKAFDSVKGVDIWRNMEAKNVCPARTWQSMKEHYRKKIIFSLDSFKNISEKDRNMLKASC